MSKIAAYNVIYFKCPECDSKNTINIFEYDYNTGLKCVNCSAFFRYEDLCKKYGNNDESGNFYTDVDNFNENSVEFTCKCGYKNIIYSRLTQTDVVEIDNEHELNGRIDHYKAPEFGLCEHCGEGYNLVYDLAKPFKDLIIAMLKIGYPGLS